MKRHIALLIAFLLCSLAVNGQTLTSAADYVNHGNELLNKGDVDGAIADYQEAIRLNSNSFEAYTNRGNALKRKGDHDGAIRDYTEAIRLNSSSWEAYFNRGVARLNKGDNDGAITDFTATTKLNPRFEQAYLGRGQARSGKEDYDGAIADYNEAIRINPRSADSFNSRAMARSDKHDFDGAIADYTESLIIKPGVANIYSNRGNVRKLKGDYDGAIADYKEAIRLDPDSAGYVNLGFLYEERKNYPAAENTFREDLRLHPNESYALVNLGYFLADHDGNLDEALKLLLRADALSPDDAEILGDLGWAYFKSGKFAEAKRYLTKAVGLDDSSFVAQEHLGDTNEKLGDRAAALAAWRKALSLIEDGDAQAKQRLAAKLKK